MADPDDIVRWRDNHGVLHGLRRFVREDSYVTWCRQVYVDRLAVWSRDSVVAPPSCLWCAVVAHTPPVVVSR